jgi:hypothetical protein
MDQTDLDAVKSTLNRAEEIDVYQVYRKSDIDQLVKDLETILQDEKELQLMQENKYYTKNTYDLVLFIYNKVLSETKARSDRVSKPKKHKLLSQNSLENLYSFAS